MVYKWYLWHKISVDGIKLSINGLLEVLMVCIYSVNEIKYIEVMIYLYLILF